MKDFPVFQTVETLRQWLDDNGFIGKFVDFDFDDLLAIAGDKEDFYDELGGKSTSGRKLRSFLNSLNNEGGTVSR